MLLGSYQATCSDLLALLVLSTWAIPASSKTLDFPLLPPLGLFQGLVPLSQMLVCLSSSLASNSSF